jgi:hypothetical protein
LVPGGTAFSQEIDDWAMVACAAVVGGDMNGSTSESAGWEQLCGRTPALKHRDRPATRDEVLNDSREHRDAEATGDADRGPLTVELESAPKRAQQVHLVTLITDGQPGAPGADNIEDEPDPTARRIGPGSTVGPAQDGVWRAHRQLEELPGVDRDR